MKSVFKLTFITTALVLGSVAFAQEGKKQEPTKSTSMEKSDKQSKKTDKKDSKKGAKESKDESKNQAEGGSGATKMVITEQGTPTKKK